MGMTREGPRFPSAFFLFLDLTIYRKVVITTDPFVGLIFFGCTFLVILKKRRGLHFNNAALNDLILDPLDEAS